MLKSCISEQPEKCLSTLMIVKVTLRLSLDKFSFTSLRVRISRDYLAFNLCLYESSPSKHSWYYQGYRHFKFIEVQIVDFFV